ncbi:MAG: hypothetical protein L3J12_08095, partial [Spirochaetales bacterium]|nr:hypothetical protein [Spirochaetales bacterium]
MKTNYFFITMILILFIPLLTLYGESDPATSQKEERIQTIKFGIDSQVIDLIDVLETEKNYEFNSDFLELLKVSNNSQLKIKIIKLLELSDDDRAVENIF